MSFRIFYVPLNNDGMKKLLLMFMLCAASSIVANAEYSLMKFTGTDGEVSYLSVENLEIVFDNGMMIASSNGGSVEFPLADIASMEFSNDSATVIEINSLTEGEVDVYSIDGKPFGKFDSASIALENLPAGIYVMNKKDGSTIKITVKK